MFSDLQDAVTNIKVKMVLVLTVSCLDYFTGLHMGLPFSCPNSILSDLPSERSPLPPPQGGTRWLSFNTRAFEQ